MATPYTLKKPTTFRRSGNDTETIELEAGVVVRYERSETDTETIHTVKYTSNGYVWSAVERIPKTPTPLPPTKGVNTAPMSVAAVNNTATATGVAVNNLTSTHRAAVSGTDAMEKRVNRLQHVVDTLSGDMYMLMYDIPTILNSEAPNPSPWLWQYGFRLNKSCWVVPQKGLDSETIQQVLKHWESIPPVKLPPSAAGYSREARVKSYVIKYDLDQLCAIKKMAVEMLDEELMRIHDSLIERIDDAAKALDTAQAALDKLESDGKDVTQRQRDKVADSYAGALRSVIRDSVKYFEACIKSAEAFDATADLKDLFSGVRNAIRARSIIVNQFLDASDRKTVDVPDSING